MKAPPCLLSVLSDPSLGGLVPALVAQTHTAAAGTAGEPKPLTRTFRLEPRFFPCCEGLGRCLDLQANQTRHCQLPQRIHGVRQLLQRYHRIWGESSAPFPIDMPAATLKQVLLRLQACHAGKSERGFLWHHEGEAQGPSLLWAVALCAIWRFGLSVHVVNLKRLLEPSYLPAMPSHAPPCLLFVEQLDKLWDVRYSEELENLISYAYRTRSPLWLELVEHRKFAMPATDQRHGAQRSRQAFTNKIANLKAKPALAWLPTAARSKLPAVTDDLFGDGRRIERRKTGATHRAEP